MRPKGIATTRARRVAHWFGVDLSACNRGAPQTKGDMTMANVRLAGGQIILITGPSGSGKSSLLARLRRVFHGRPRGAWIDFDAVRPPPDRRAIDAMADAMGGGDDDPAIVAALVALSRVGLGEVWSYLRRPTELSEGQRWRLRLALALARAQDPPPLPPGPAIPTPASPPDRAPARTGGKERRDDTPRAFDVLAADEFAAPLDRVTAMVVARALRRAVDARPHLAAVVATSHDDLVTALDPDVLVRCDFDGAFTVCQSERRSPERPTGKARAAS
jgi:ABC-type ATPase with predicted acetyltransferase domain